MSVREEAELARVRAEIAERRGFADDVARAEGLIAASTETFQGVAVRCEEGAAHSHPNDAPKLADAALVLGGLLVVAKIKWRPSDQINLRPWDRDSHLGAGLNGDALERVMTDDRALSEWLDQLDGWERGESVRPEGGFGPRWLISEPPRIIRTMLLPDRASPIRAWVRCPRQGEHEELTYAQLAVTLR